MLKNSIIYLKMEVTSGILILISGLYMKPEARDGIGGFMRYCIIVTHAYMADGIKSTLELIIGEQKNLLSYCAYVDPNIICKDSIIEQINKYDESDEVIIFTDIYGGSVNNEMMEVMTKRKNTYLVTGINLPLLINVLLDNSNELIEDMLNRNIEEAKKSIILCNNLYEECSENLDDF